ncbi:hypothetical protein SAMN05216388_100718 [Halorientalis persicus]|uniref:PIN domain-containing protein n=1 Tax=Halorientalis persicus TaxID=1367881 RepID=A0A1H8L5F2_9EURY|nr:hypothetical protein [Halorientalis persicus]SEO00311.1 hypothetical protein SAMN05216388_100718 [Halorientalis persicus]
MTDDTRHPVIVDSDALIAVANTDLWSHIIETLHLTTTNVCQQELQRHTREKSAHAPDGTRERWIHDGSKAALEPFTGESEAFTVVPCVPRPHGEDAGETSIQREVEQHPETYTYAILMDKHGRMAINRVFDSQSEDGKAVAPPFLLYLLLEHGACTGGQGDCPGA